MGPERAVERFNPPLRHYHPTPSAFVILPGQRGYLACLNVTCSSLAVHPWFDRVIGPVTGRSRGDLRRHAEGIGRHAV